MSENKSLQIRLPEETLNKVGAASEKVRLSKNDVIKLAIERGLPLVERALGLTGEELAGLPERAPQTEMPQAA